MKLSLIFFLFSISAFAVDMDQVTKILGSKIAVDPLTCEPDSADSEMGQKCAQAICGEAGTYPNMLSSGRELDDFKPTKEIKDEIDRSVKLVDENTKAWQDHATKEINGLKELIKSNSSDIVSINMIPVSLVLNKFVSYRVDGDKIKMVPDFPSKLDARIKRGIQSWIRNKEKSIQNDPVIRVRLGLNTPAQSMKVMKEKLELLKKKSEEIPAQYGFNFDRYFAPVKEIFETSDYTERHVMIAEDFLDKLKTSVTPNNEVAESKGHPKDSACEKECIDALAPLFKKNEFLKRLEKVSTRLSERENYMKRCKAGLEVQAKFGQLPSQREKALKIVDSALTKFTEQKWFSSHTKDGFKSFIKDETKIAHKFETENIITADNFGQVMGREKAKFTDAFLVETIVRLDMQPGNIYAQAFPFCPSPSFLTTDSFQYSLVKPTLNVSPFSCGHEGIGEGIVAHELGHGLSAFMSEHAKKSPESLKKYLSIRNCVNKLSPGKAILLYERPVLFAGDGLTTEEDLADWQSFESVRSDRPMACSLLPPEGKKYEKNSISLRPQTGDNHSSSLLRAMRQWHQQKGSLPAICNQYLAAFKDFVEVKKCE